MKFDGIMQYQEKDMALTQLKNSFFESEIYKRNKKALGYLEVTKRNIEAFDSEIESILTKYTEIKSTIEDLKSELEEFDDYIAGAETEADIDFYTRKIQEIQDKLVMAEKSLSQDSNRMEEINLEYAKNTNLQKQANEIYNTTTPESNALRSKIQAEGRPIQAEMDAIAKDIEPELLKAYTELKKSKTVKNFPIITEIEANGGYCICGMQLEKEPISILKSGRYIQCGRCHRLIFYKQ